jgi:hypothetical protein
MAYVPKKANKGYDLEKDIESLGKRGRKKGAKKRAANKKFKEGQVKAKENWASKLKRNVQMLLKGKNYKVPAKKKKKK